MAHRVNVAGEAHIPYHIDGLRVRANRKVNAVLPVFGERKQGGSVINFS
jgi:hypothetical protein